MIFMKKILAALLAVVMIISFCACTKEKETALVISGTEIDTEIFTYYFHKVVERPADYGVDIKAKDKVFKDAAIQECKEYLAVNTRFANEGLKLTAAEKVEISHTVNDLWLRFENHYNSIGISKQTLTKIHTAEAYRDKLFTDKYDLGIDNLGAESIIQNYFYSNYISFRNICVYFTKADGTVMSQLERNQLLETMNSMKEITDIQKFSDAATAAGFSASDSVILNRNGGGYPDGFFDRISGQADNTVQIIEYDDCVFAVIKENLRDKGESVYASYRSTCISNIYSSEYQQEIIDYTDDMEVDEKNSVDKIVNKYL